MELTRDGIVVLLTARRNAEQVKIIPTELCTTDAQLEWATHVNNIHDAVIAVLDEMIGAIHSIQSELNNDKMVWPMNELNEIAKQQNLHPSQEIRTHWHD